MSETDEKRLPLSKDDMEGNVEESRTITSEPLSHLHDPNYVGSGTLEDPYVVSFTPVYFHSPIVQPFEPNVGYLEEV